MAIPWPFTVSGIEALLEERRREEQTIRVEFESRLSGVHADVLALERSLDLARAKVPHHPAADIDPPVEDLGPATPPIDWKQELAGLSQAEAIVRVAAESGGVVRTVDAKLIFLAAGLIHGNPKYANQRVTSLLLNADRFTRIAPGTYRLVEPVAPAESLPDTDEAPETPHPGE